MAGEGFHRDLFAKVVGRFPFGRAPSADEVAAVAVFLASDAAAQVTGQTISVNGGLSFGAGDAGPGGAELSHPVALASYWSPQALSAQLPAEEHMSKSGLDRVCLESIRTIRLFSLALFVRSGTAGQELRR